MQIYINILLTSFVLLLVPSKCEQDFKYNIPNHKLIEEHLRFQSFVIPNIAVQAIKYFPKSYSKLGTENYTIFLQKAIDENEIVIIPDFPVMAALRGATEDRPHVPGLTRLLQNDEQVIRVHLHAFFDEDVLDRPISWGGDGG